MRQVVIVANSPVVKAGLTKGRNMCNENHPLEPAERFRKQAIDKCRRFIAEVVEFLEARMEIHSGEVLDQEIVGHLHIGVEEIPESSIRPSVMANQSCIPSQGDDSSVVEPVKVGLSAAEVSDGLVDLTEVAEVKIMVSEHEVHRASQALGDHPQVSFNGVPLGEVAGDQNTVRLFPCNLIEEAAACMPFQKIEMNICQPGESFHGP